MYLYVLVSGIRDCIHTDRVKSTLNLKTLEGTSPLTPQHKQTKAGNPDRQRARTIHQEHGEISSHPGSGKGHPCVRDYANSVITTTGKARHDEGPITSAELRCSRNPMYIARR